MTKLLTALLIVVSMVILGTAGMQVAGDDGPDGNGSVPWLTQMAGDDGPDGNG